MLFTIAPEQLSLEENGGVVFAPCLSEEDVQIRERREAADLNSKMPTKEMFSRHPEKLPG